jgi:murein L,D-transpeptidase YafK
LIPFPTRLNTRCPSKLVNKMKANDMSTRSPIMMRIFKEEGVLEVWKQKGNGRYDIIASYEICKWSGKLGPKFKEGDRQAPEGYYRIYPAR